MTTPDQKCRECPFCGNQTPEVRHIGSYCSVWCRQCGGSGGTYEYDREDDAINAWNTRANPILPALRNPSDALIKAVQYAFHIADEGECDIEECWKAAIRAIADKLGV